MFNEKIMLFEPEIVPNITVCQHIKNNVNINNSVAPNQTNTQYIIKQTISNVLTFWCQAPPIIGVRFGQQTKAQTYTSKQSKRTAQDSGGTP